MADCNRTRAAQQCHQDVVIGHLSHEIQIHCVNTYYRKGFLRSIDTEDLQIGRIYRNYASRRTMNLSMYYGKQMQKKHIVHCELWEKLCLDVKCAR
jgi:hypothetical protein